MSADQRTEPRPQTAPQQFDPVAWMIDLRTEARYFARYMRHLNRRHRGCDCHRWRAPR